MQIILFHHLHLEPSLAFRQICNREILNIEYASEEIYSDIEVVDNKLVAKSNEGKYSLRQDYMPDTSSKTDSVGDTELISTFLARLNIDQVNRQLSTNC